jgi:hypothetical protein
MIDESKSKPGFEFLSGAGETLNNDYDDGPPEDTAPPACKILVHKPAAGGKGGSAVRKPK